MKDFFNQIQSTLIKNLILKSFRWILLSRSIQVLQEQLAQAHEDLSRLEELKKDAIADPEAFIRLLKDPQESSNVIPRPQKILRVPDINLSRFQRRTSRRGSSKYEQNLEYLMGRVLECQRKPLPLSGPILSSMIPLSRRAEEETPAGSTRQGSLLNGTVQSVRERFLQIAGPSIMRSASVPAISMNPSNSGRQATPSPIAKELAGEVPTAEPPPQPTAKKARRGTRVPIFDAPNSAVAAHYNLPWSEEEKRRMDELLLIYPEEDVQARRYAKIAAALGTRTASQVANRLHKLQAKRARMAASYGLSSSPVSSSAEVVVADNDGDHSMQQQSSDLSALLIEESQLDPAKLETPEYREYLRLKAELERQTIKLLVHEGYRCDMCHCEPIRAVRWHCMECPPNNEVDLCGECHQRGAAFETTSHKSSHRMKMIDS